MAPFDADVERSLTGALAGSPLAFVMFTWWSYCGETLDLLEVTREGIGVLTSAPELLSDTSREKWQLDYAEKIARLAQRESDADYATVYAHSLLGLWGAFECFIEDTFIACIRADETLLRSDAFSRMKLPVSILFSENNDEKYQAVLNEVSRRSAETAGGISRHESLLALVGLSGPVPKDIGRRIYQAHQIRNVWAHRGGLADQRLLDCCPDLEFRVGERVSISTQLFQDLVSAMRRYSALIVNRYLKSAGRAQLDIESDHYMWSLFFAREEDMVAVKSKVPKADPT